MTLTTEDIYTKVVNWDGQSISLTMTCRDIEHLLNELESGVCIMGNYNGHSRQTCRRLFGVIASQVMGYNVILNDPFAETSKTNAETPIQPKKRRWFWDRV